MITIDEQIARQRAVIRHCEGKSGINIDGDKAILATLERIKAAEAGLPVEPEWLKVWRDTLRKEGMGSAIISHIDTLRAYAALKEAENAALRKDAERYRWLADKVMACDYGDNNRGCVGWNIRHCKGPDWIAGLSIDAAIDQARAK